MCSRTGLGTRDEFFLNSVLLLQESATIVWYSRHGVCDSVIGRGVKDLQDLQVGYTRLPRSAPCTLGEININHGRVR